jgi:AraC-like DNA-binding protein
MAAWLPVRRYIEEHLHDLHLSVDQTALEFGVSRATLYRMMVRYGGFASYLRQRRLHRSRDDLLDPSKVHLTIAEIAERWGFANAANYSTAFKDLFDMTPRDFRHMTRSRGHRMNELGSESDWSRWLASMR